jgi:hypothetical protein
MTKPVCSLSLDLDNQWSYMKTHGDPGWECFPSYFDIVVPRVLEILENWDWMITFFVVGQDAALERNHEALGLITAAGHEIGNHSFQHEPWLHMYSKQETEEEIARAEDSIEAATGRKPQGFRGPGFSFSRTMLDVLRRRNYLYDASTFPTYLGPLARAYYFATSDFSKEDKQQRKALFGSLRDGLRPVRPYLWDLGDTDLLEIPVTTMPLFKLPFHFSYLLYISTYSVALSLLYFKVALGLCRMTGTEPSLLLHPLDFLGGDDVPELAFFPAMHLKSQRKLDLLDRFFRVLATRYTVQTVGEHAKRLRLCSSLKGQSP